MNQLLFGTCHYISIVELHKNFSFFNSLHFMLQIDVHNIPVDEQFDFKKMFFHGL